MNIEETTSSEDIQTTIKELNSVIENSESLEYGDIMREIAKAYRIASVAAANSDVETAEKIKAILPKLNELAEQKKATASPKVETTTLKEMKAEKKTKKEALVENKPDETSVKHSEPAIEVSPNEPIDTVAKPEQMIPAPKLDEFQVAEQKREIPKPVLEDTEETKVEEKQPEPPAMTVPQQKPIPVPESKPEIVLDEPEVEKENIIVPTKEDEKDEAETAEPDAQEELMNDITDVFTAKPFDGDDPDDIEIVDVDNREQLDVQTKAEVDKEKERKRIEEAEKEYNTAPDDVDLYNVKAVSRKKVSDTLKALAALDTSHVNVQKLEMFDFDINDQTIRKEYMKTRNDMVSAPRISRIALLMSGHYEEVSAYGNYDLISVERNLYSKTLSYADKERLMYESIHAHINYVSYAKEKPDFDTWAQNIYYPDINSLYFGVYDANSVGSNKYTFDCPFCGQEMSVYCGNAELSVGVPKGTNKDELEKFITNKDIMALDSTDMSKWAKNTRVRKMLPDTNIIVDFAVPTVFEYLTTLYTLEKINQRDLGGRLDLSLLDGFTAETEEEEIQQIEDFNRIMACIYIKRIGIPTRVEGTGRYRYIGITSKADIIEHVNALTENDYAELLNGKEVRELITRKATKYYLRDCKCKNDKCGKDIKYVSIDPRAIFFFKIGEGRNKRMM